MLYEKNKAESLSDELFKSPTSEYRAAPFWSWNCDLNEKELLLQIEELKQMGFGGFHMHCRKGMSTEYLSEDFMKLVKACVKKAKKEDMLAWLYDEDRWPSGFAGGIVTKEVKYRGRHLVFSPDAPNEGEAHIDFGIFDIILDENGTLESYSRINDATDARGDVWYAYEKVLVETPRYNNQTYVDTLNPEAIKKFLEITYDAYKDAVGKEFDKTIPAMFTDEPQFTRKQRLTFARAKQKIILPWTDDLEDAYTAEYGESLVEHIPELIWDLPCGAPSLTRYRYHDHVGRRFVKAFCDQCGEWCGKNKIQLTGHMMDEPTLGSQTGVLGEAMPSYRGFQMPGIDILCAAYEFTTAKQCQSAVRQYGREAMMSELYGVTSWDFDFRDYKLSGDWQAAMGVTVRVPHLAWVSMQGEAKRDYPAAIGYQSPWFRKFGCVEDHFARLATALSRGKSVVRVGVIHPVESFWLHWGPKEQSELACQELESNFKNITDWLSFGGYDFDYISETLLPELCKKGGAPLKVGKMEYDAIVVPACETLRKSTVDRLEAFRRAGGKLIFMGDAPKFMDAVPSDVPAKLYKNSKAISFSCSAILCELEEFREIELRLDDGSLAKKYIYQMRQDKDDRWLFVCRAALPYNKNISNSKAINFSVKGEWSVKLYDTLNGEIKAYESSAKNGWTQIRVKAYDYDSFLFRLAPIEKETELSLTVPVPVTEVRALDTASIVDFELGEPNALLLDMAEYALDDEPYREREEILRADTLCRNRLGWQVISGDSAQPWCLEEEKIDHSIRLRFTVNSEIRVYGAMLAIERHNVSKIVWNGTELSKTVKGYYVDRSIKTLRIPVINKGVNTLEITVPFGKRVSTEWCYIIGNFGTKVVGSETVIVPLADKLGYGDIVPQTLNFYSGTLDYKIDVNVPEECDGDELVVTVPQYLGSLVEVLLDEKESGEVIYPPYKLSLGRVEKGAHKVTLRLYVPRTNGFGPVHLSDEKYGYPGPKSWRTANDSFGYEYHFKREGIMMKPKFECVKH